MVGPFLIIWFLIVLGAIVFVSIFASVFSWAAVYIIQWKKGKSEKEALRKALIVAAIVLIGLACVLCIMVVVYYLVTPFYLP
jgi:hypothetical protein